MKNHAFFSILALVFAGWAAQAGAIQVLIDAYWANINTASPKEGGGSNLTNGSIVQVVLFNSHGGQEPSNSEPGDNFQPYGSSWIPNSTKEGNQIIYTGELTVNGTTAEFYEWVDIPNALLAVYDKIYIRVFSDTEFTQGEVNESYWGVSDIQSIPGGSGGTAWTWFDDVAVTNFATFEVIPEPGVLSLLAVGAWGLGGAAFRRMKQRNSKESPFIRESEP